MRLLVTAVLLLALSAFAVPQAEHEDVAATLQRAHEALDTAKRELDSVPNELGIHGRNKALDHVAGALVAVEQTQAWAREHHDLKK